MVRMGDRMELYVIAGSIVVGLLSSAYYALLRAPAVMQARPALPELGFWTALFSGRFMEWLYYTHTPFAVGFTVTLWLGIGVTIVWLGR